MAKKQKPVTVQSVIEDLLAEGPLVGLYFVVGINILHEQVSSMTNEEITEMFSGLINPNRIRQNVNTIHDRVNNFSTE